MASQVGLEPTTTRLTVECSTIELQRNILLAGLQGIEPRSTDPNSVVLPLDDSPILVRVAGVKPTVSYSQSMRFINKSLLG